MRSIFVRFDRCPLEKALDREIRLDRQQPFECCRGLLLSAEIAEVLRAYEVWQQKSGGAFNGQVGELVRVWKEAEKANALPEAAVLERIVRPVHQVMGGQGRRGSKGDAADRNGDMDRSIGRVERLLAHVMASSTVYPLSLSPVLSIVPSTVTALFIFALQSWWPNGPFGSVLGVL